MIEYRKILSSLLISSLLRNEALGFNVRRTEQVLGDEGCTYLLADIQYEQGHMPSGPTRADNCLLSSGELVHIEGLTNEFKLSKEAKGLISNQSIIRIPGASIANGVLTVPNDAKVSVESTGSTMATSGTKKVLVVRAKALDSETTSSATTISDEIFGTSTDAVNLKSQYKACSYNQLIFEPVGALGGVSTTGGVGSVVVNVNANGVDNSVVREAMIAAADAKYGTLSSLVSNGSLHHVMLCLPPGTSGGWIAYAYVNHYISVYNDNWCNYPSGQMHELGHNLGLAHSGETATYDDQSGMMGYSYGEDEGPIMCFNAPKNWQLGWYPNGQHSINPSIGQSYSGRLIGISDYGSIDNNKKVIIQITGYSEDYYVSFNRKTGINSGTYEGGDQVLVHSRPTGLGYAESKLLAKLSAGGTTTIGGDTVIKAITVNTSTNPGYADVSIIGPTSPTVAPVTPPTTAPVTPPTPAPVTPPTAAPVTPPTPAPVTSPTGPTTPYPTHTVPTMYPTEREPTPYPTEVPPTPYPTGGQCAVKGEYCKRHSHCCSKKCNKIKGFCRQ